MDSLSTGEWRVLGGWLERRDRRHRPHPHLPPQQTHPDSTVDQPRHAHVEGETVEVDDTRFRILDQHDTMLTVVPRTNTEEVTRYKAYGHKAARA